MDAVLTENLNRGSSLLEEVMIAPRSQLFALDSASGTVCVASPAGVGLYDAQSYSCPAPGLAKSSWLGGAAIESSEGNAALPTAVTFVSGDEETAVPCLAVLAEGDRGDEIVFLDVYRTASAGVGRSLRSRAHVVVSGRVSLGSCEERGRVTREMVRNALGGPRADGKDSDRTEALREGARGDFSCLVAHPSRPWTLLVANSTSKAQYMYRSRGEDGGDEMKTIELDHDGQVVTCAAFDEHGEYVVTGDVTGRCRVWRIEGSEADQVREVHVGCGVTAVSLVSVPYHSDAVRWMGVEEPLNLAYDFGLSHLVLAAGHGNGEVSFWWLAPRNDAVVTTELSQASGDKDVERSVSTEVRLRHVPSAAYPCMHAGRGHIAGFHNIATPTSIFVLAAISGTCGLRRFELQIKPELPASVQPPSGHVAPRYETSYDSKGHRKRVRAPPPILPFLTRPRIAFPSYRAALAAPLFFRDQIGSVPLGGAIPTGPLFAKLVHLFRSDEACDLADTTSPISLLLLLSERGLHIAGFTSSDTPNPSSLPPPPQPVSSSSPPPPPSTSSQPKHLSDIEKLHLPSPLSETPLPTIEPIKTKLLGPESSATITSLSTRIAVANARLERMRDQTRMLRQSFSLFSDQVSNSLALLASKLDRQLELQQQTSQPSLSHTEPIPVATGGLHDPRPPLDFWNEEEDEK